MPEDDVDTPELLASLADLAREISAAPDQQTALESIVATAADLLPDIDSVGVSLAYPDGRLETRASSNPFAAKLDELQAALGSGPCIYAAEAETIVRVEPARHEQRWPEFIAEALPLGLRSMLGVRLAGDGGSMGALNLSSTSSDRISPETTHLADLFAAQAAAALGWLRREDELSQAMESRRTIGMALGIVMQRFSVDDSRAFEYLVRLSNHQNTKLRVVAARLVEEHLAHVTALHDAPDDAQRPKADA